ncbi:MAG: exodeoxyribonuclease VII large subunit, partial [Pseudomonadota bacterium]
LLEEGLFDEKRKRQLPLLPKKIGVVTSPSGAVIRDIIQVSQRRFGNMHILLSPARVQGEGAAEEIIRALEMLNRLGDIDVIIIARGGGSLEDLQPFNTEELARAIAQSQAPVVSAVGHETDYTICDFVADLRAPTPSAAAELVIPKKTDLLARIDESVAALYRLENQKISILQKHLHHLSKRLVHPARRIAGIRLRMDDFVSRIALLVSHKLHHKKNQLAIFNNILAQQGPRQKFKLYHAQLRQSLNALFYATNKSISGIRGSLNALTGKLDLLSPISTLERGYSITRTISGQRIVRDVKAVSEGEGLEVIVGRGMMQCRIERKDETNPWQNKILKAR